MTSHIGFGPAALWSAFFYAFALGPTQSHDLPCLPIDPANQIKSAFNELPVLKGKTEDGTITIYSTNTGSSFSVVFKPDAQPLWCAVIIGKDIKPAVKDKVKGEQS